MRDKAFNIAKSSKYDRCQSDLASMFYKFFDNKFLVAVLIFGIAVLILDKWPIQGLDDTAFLAEAKHPINFTQSGKRLVLSLHHNGSNSFLFVNATKVCQFKAEKSEIKNYALCLGNVSKDFIVNNMKKKTGLKRVKKILFLLILILLILTIF